MRPEPRAYRPDIDGLRALAVVAVILNHLDHRLLPGGYLGVDIFFVISGFVITTSLQQRPAERLSQMLGDFFARRCRRLVPALALCTVASGIAAWLIAPNPAVSLNTGITALAGMSNVFLLFTLQDYFAPSTALNLFTQTWSLGVEEQFYLLFPILVWATGLARARSGASRLFFACLGLSLLSLIALLLLPGKDGGAAYFLVFGRLWELGCGVMAALMPRLTPRRPALAWFSLGAMILVMALPIPASVLVSVAIVPPTAILILGSELNLLACRPVVGIGRMSYSLYLWHWPVVSASLLAFGRFRWHIPLELGPILLLGAGSYLLVERPARTRLAILPRRWSFLSALASVAIAAGVLLGLKHWPNPSPLTVRLFAEIPADFAAFPDKHSDYALECAADGAGRPLRPTTFERCTLPPRIDVQNTIWSMGDSHAGHLAGLLIALREFAGFGIHLIETPGVAFPIPPGTQFPERDAIFAMTLPKLRPGDTVLLGRLFLTRDGPFAPLPDVEAWIPSLEALADRLRPLGVQVVVAGPPPIFRFASIYGCAPTPNGTTGCDIQRASLAAAIDPIEAALNAAASRQPNLHIFSQFAVLCPPTGTSCTPVRAGVPQYRDKDHLNSAGSASLAPAFLLFLAKLRGP